MQKADRLARDIFICKMYKSGKSARDITEILDISLKQTFNILKCGNIPNQRAKRHVDKQYFEHIDTDDKAYWLGFIYGDGSIRYGTVNITSSLSDSHHLLRFRKAVKSDHAHWKNESILRVYVHSKEFVDYLRVYGLTENKTFKLVYPEIDPVFDRHFIRGVYNADGCLNKNMEQWSITGYKPFMREVQCKMVQYLGVGRTKIRASGANVDTATLEYSGKTQVGNILDWLHRDAITYLERKRRR